MEDKILDLLKQGAMSISDIRDNLGDLSRSQLMGVLNKMTSDKTIFKKIVNDKSYFYLEGNDVRAVNISFEYDESKIFKNEKYSFKIPDAFEMVDDLDRDFVCYLPNGSGKKYDNGGADIIVFSSNYIPISDKLKKMVPEVRSTLYEVVFWSAGKDLLDTLDEAEYELVNVGMEAGLITGKVESQYNFYFICFLNNEYKVIHIVIEDGFGSLDKLKEIAIKLVKGFTAKANYDDVLALNDSKYMVDKLDDKIIDEWINNLKDVDLNISVLLDLMSKSEKNRYDILKSDKDSFEKRLKERVKWVCFIFDRYLVQARDFVLKVRNDNSEELLIPIYYNLNLFIGNCGEVKIDIEGKIISEISSKVGDIYYELFDEKILRMIEEYSSGEENNEDLPLEDTSEEYSDFIDKSKDDFDKICMDLNLFMDGYLDEIRDKTSNSEFALKLEINSIKKTAGEFGDRFENFLIGFDKEARNINDDDIKLEIKRIVKDVFFVLKSIHLDFSLNNIDMGSFDYEISKQALKIKDYWLGEEKYDDNDLYSILSFEVDCEEEKWKKESSEIQKIIDDENSVKVHKEIDKLSMEYNESVKKVKDEVKELKKANLEISDEIDGLSRINFRKKDKLNKELEANIQDITFLEKKLMVLKEDFDRKKEDLKKVGEVGDIIVPISPKELLSKVDDLFKTDLKSYKEDQEYMNCIMDELTYFSKEVTVSELVEHSDKLSNLSDIKISNLLSLLEKEGKINKEIISKKSYYSINEEYKKSYKLNVSLNYSFGEDINRIYNVLIDLGSVSFAYLCDDVHDLSKTRILQVLYYLFCEDKVYMKHDDKIKICLR